MSKDRGVKPDASSPNARIGRRGLLGGAIAAVSLGLAHIGTRTVAAHARPKASGASTTRCAQCGSQDHAMLSQDCPASPGVL